MGSSSMISCCGLAARTWYWWWQDLVGHTFVRRAVTDHCLSVCLFPGDDPQCGGAMWWLHSSFFRYCLTSTAFNTSDLLNPSPVVLVALPANWSTLQCLQKYTLMLRLPRNMASTFLRALLLSRAGLLRIALSAGSYITPQSKLLWTDWFLWDIQSIKK